MRLPRTLDQVFGPTCEKNLALIQTSVGEKCSAISTLTELLKTPYDSWIYGSAPIYADPFETRSDLGSVALRSRFPKTL